MEFKKLGNTGLDVSRVCIGCMSYGIPERGFPEWSLSEDESYRMIEHALNLGINFFDTANVYSDGSSEEITGKALKKLAKREEIVLATKVCLPTGKGPNMKGLSRKSIMQQIDYSLKRLETDYVDLYIIHRWDNDTPIEETMEALHDLVKAGKVRYLGASSMYAWQFAKAQATAKQNGWTKFISMQNKYNLIYREKEREMIPLLQDQKIAMTPYQPLAGGRIARSEKENTVRSQTQAGYKRKEEIYSDACETTISSRIGELAEVRNVSKSMISLAWLYSKSFVTAPIVGASKTSQLDDAAKALEIKLTDKEVAYLEEPYIPHILRF